MMDFYYPAPPSLVAASKPLADFLALWTLPYHIHEVFAAFVIYQLIFSLISPLASSWFLPRVYHGLPVRRRISWNVHVTSMVQSTFITVMALYVIWTDEERRRMDWIGRIWGYTGAMGVVQGLAAGYFLWDLIASVIHFNVLGPGSLAHAVSALLVTSMGFRPFANYYGLNFILYEISTPFLNMHWFFDKLSMTGSRIQLYNGIALMVTFFGSRVLWGNYQSICIYADVWTALHTPTIDLKYADDASIFAYRKFTGLEGISNSHDMKLPLWLVFAYLGSNTLLNFLNIYWFMKMVQAMRKRFQTSKVTKKL
ncbi:TLC domain-containing protein [Rhexocercosporidium sp. MPI-PUGE-AT-0058]|nr:TLC domain-containing protein [Rhexocercosporidium sp. MPI-PUGE-AT-0058]